MNDVDRCALEALANWKPIAGVSSDGLAQVYAMSRVAKKALFP